MGVVTTANSSCEKFNAVDVSSYIDLSIDDGVIVTKFASWQGSITVSMKNCYVVYTVVEPKVPVTTISYYPTKFLSF